MPELVRRMNVVACDHDPVPPMVDVLAAMAEAHIPLGDVVVDSGYAHRVPEHFALPLRAAGATLVMDLHPSDRSTQGTHQGATCHHGNLLLPGHPQGPLRHRPSCRGASKDETAAHDQRYEELSRYKLGRIGADDEDGYHRVACPAVAGKLRCPLRDASMQPTLEHPEVLCPPEQPPTCGTQVTITVPPQVNAKTAQRHDYTSKAWRRSYARRSAPSARTPGSRTPPRSTSPWGGAG